LPGAGERGLLRDRIELVAPARQRLGVAGAAQPPVAVDLLQQVPAGAVGQRGAPARRQQRAQLAPPPGEEARQRRGAPALAQAILQRPRRWRCCTHSPSPSCQRSTVYGCAPIPPGWRRTVARITARVPSASSACERILCVIPLPMGGPPAPALRCRAACTACSCCGSSPGIAASASGGAVFGSGVERTDQIVMAGSSFRYSVGVMPSTCCSSSRLANGPWRGP